MRQTTWTPVYFIAQLFYFIALVRTALGSCLAFWNATAITKFQVELPHRGVQYTGVGKIAILTEIVVCVANVTR